MRVDPRLIDERFPLSAGVFVLTAVMHRVQSPRPLRLLQVVSRMETADHGVT